MPPIVKNVLAFFAGGFIGSMVNMSIIIVGPMIIPLPEGVDMNDMDKFAENLKLLEPVNFIAPWLAHAMGTLVGAVIATKIANSKMVMAMIIGVLFLVGGIMMVVQYGGPLPFVVTDLVLAYLPMAYLGGIIGGGRNPRASETQSDDEQQET